MSSSNKDNFIVVGKIATAFGVKGWVKVISFTQPTENLMTLVPWYLKTHQTWQPLKIEECKPHSDTLVVKLAQCNDRDAAMLLRGKEIAVTREQLPDLEADEYYWTDLEGLNVVTVDGLTLGSVSYIFATGSNDVLVIKDKTTKKEIFIPFLLDQFIKKVDLTEKVIEVDWDPDF